MRTSEELHMSARCRECADGLAHCHGTVILHIGQRAECTDDCGAPEVEHTYTIDCVAIGCGCAQDQPIGSGTLSSGSLSA
ncbi:hypothetical protein [Mycolicibacterium cosmeticum]|uniref:hypothetical protein n=1 Tax=Mycolicibacterium cosmeticum TaxID=258533 RepID=UPI003204D207